MEKITVLSCTNRPNSNTLKVSRLYEKIVKEAGAEVQVLDFCTLPETIAFSETFGKRSESYKQVIANYVSAATHFILVVPEYNGSFPGILKTFLDSMHPREWENKYACLVGVSDGRAGNLRGLEHLTGILHYLKMRVYHNKLPISLINKVMDAEGNFITDEQINACKAQVAGFLKH